MTLTKADVLEQLDALKRIVEGMPESTEILQANIGCSRYIQLYTGIRGVARTGSLTIDTRNDPRREFLELRVRQAGFDIFELREKKTPPPALEHRERQAEGASPS